MKRMKKILCIGDRVTLGARATRGYPEHLWEQLRADGRESIVQNAGLDHGGLVEVTRTLPAVCRQVGSFDAIVLLAPPYDARGNGINPREYRTLLHQTITLSARLLAESARERETLVICSPTPIGERTTVRGFARPARRWHPRAAEIVREVASEYDSVFVPLHQMDRALLADSVHPKPEGYRWIASQVAQALVGAGW